MGRIVGRFWVSVLVWKRVLEWMCMRRVIGCKGCVKVCVIVNIEVVEDVFDR